MAQKGVNKVILMGNIGQDVEVKFMPNGKAVASISIATSESWKDQNGQAQERTEWHRCVAYGKPAEIIGQYCQKGSKLYVEGKLNTRKWQDQSGSDRYTTEIIIDQFQFVGGDKQQAQRPQQQAQQPAPMSKRPPAPQAEPDFDFDDSIPF